MVEMMWLECLGFASSIRKGEGEEHIKHRMRSARTHTHTFCTLLICLTLWEYTSLQQVVDIGNGGVVRALGI